MIDEVVKSVGVDVSHHVLTGPQRDAWDNLDPDTSTTTTTVIKAVKSQPREEDHLLVGGREARLSLRLTVESTVDVRADRDGRGDRFTVDSRLYQVMLVVDETHPWTGVRKKTVLLESLSGIEA